MKKISEAYLNLTLRNKFIIPVIIVMFVSFIVLTVILLRDQRTKFETGLRAKADRITRLLLSSNLESIWDIDHEALKLNCKSFFEDKELTKLVIIERLYDNEVLIDMSKKTSGSGDILKTADFVREGRKVARLEAVFTNHYIERDLARMRNTILGLSIPVFVLVIVLIIIVSQIALRPLRGLMAGVQNLATGELTFRIPLQSSDELGRLAVSFNTMAHELNQYHDRLRELVEQRTAELTTANEYLRREIAERKKAEDALRVSESELRALFAGMTDVILMLDREGRHLKIAPTSPELLHRPADELIGKTLHEVFPKDKAGMFSAYIHQTLETREITNFEYSLDIGGNDIRFDARMAPMSPDTVIFVARDISERKQMENDLWQAKEAAEAADLAKSVFLANMSHGLRTPLHGILGFARRLEKDTLLTETQRENVDIIYRNAEQLLLQLNDILDFAKIEANTLEISPSHFALPGMLNQLASRTRLEASRKGLAFSYEAPEDVPLILCGDQKRLRQILLNLLRNAVKYTENGRIAFRLEIREAKKAESAILRFEVEDTGPGIPPNHIEGIFQPFQQADPCKLQEGSTGLGLSVSRRLAVLMGGRIHVDSVPGRGSIFRFDLELPVAEFSPVQSCRISEKTVPETEDMRRDLAELPAEWLTQMANAAKRADFMFLSTAIARIRQYQPMIADALEPLLEDFRYDEILKIVGRRD